MSNNDQDWKPVFLVKDKQPTKQENHTNITNVKKELLNDDVPTLKYVDKELSKEIVNARVAKNLNRKQLANNMNIQENIVADFETGKALHNPQLISKFKSYLGLNKK